MDLFQAVAAYLSVSIWSPYLVGVGIGVLSWLAFLLSDHPIGASTAFAKSAGMIEKALRGPDVIRNPIIRKTRRSLTGNGCWWPDCLSGRFPRPGFPGTSPGNGCPGCGKTPLGRISGCAWVKKRVLPFGSFGGRTLIDLARVNNPWVVIFPVTIAVTGFLIFQEMTGL
jgi:hypothetical protein